MDDAFIRDSDASAYMLRATLNKIPVLKYRYDLRGFRFGKLTIIDVADDRFDVGRGQRRWHARCDCGNVILVAAHAVKSGNTKSCGCLRSGKSKARVPSLPRGKGGKFVKAAKP